jgi:chromosomal replication initiation ATPase DnaA
MINDKTSNKGNEMKNLHENAKNLANNLSSNYGAKVNVSQNTLKVNGSVNVNVIEKNGKIMAYISSDMKPRSCREAINNVPRIVEKINWKANGKFQLSSIEANTATTAVNPIPEFDILERFSFMSKMAKMVIAGVTPSLLITGEGGLGKTYTVTQELVNANLEEDIDYVIVKGYSSARGLYNTLYENSDKLIVFDDCDSILKDATAVNLLKAALDSYDRRVISWNCQSFGSDIPNRFEFTGKIIFISNLSQNRIDQAVKSRALRVDLSMTPSEKIRRMESILDVLLPEYTMEIKTDALNFLDKNKEIATELNMRSLIQVCKIRGTFSDDWEGVAMYTLTA